MSSRGERTIIHVVAAHTESMRAGHTFLRKARLYVALFSMISWRVIVA
jgi:hypothetical protein